MQGTMNEAKKWMVETRVGGLFPEGRGEIFSVNTTTPIPEAFKLLIKHKILSAPVYDIAAKKYIGWLDILDLVTHTINVLDESELMGGELPLDVESSERFSKQTCGSIVGISRRNPYYPVEKRAPLLKAIEAMVKYRLHRLPIIDEEGDLETVVSQSHIAQLLHQHMNVMGDLATATVAELSLGLRQVITVTERNKAIEAFKLIHERNVSAIAVVSSGEEGAEQPAGSLIGNLSASDLKAVSYNAHMISNLFVSVKEFLGKLNTTKAPISVTVNHNFQEVVAKIVESRIHRVYVVDSENKPIGVISLLEVLSAIVERF
ncbi:hypothetical protein QOT17_007624 [Balamuthia mandrillaris]